MIRDLVLASGGSSPVGVNWTYQSDMAVEWAKNTFTPNASTHYPTSIAWSGTQFCVVGAEGSCATSPDGVNWTQQPGLKSCGFDHFVPAVICWGGNRFCVVGGGGQCATSVDGVTWTLGPGTAPSQALLYLYPLDIVWSGSRFCVVGFDVAESAPYGAPGVIATSPDGVTWSYQHVGTLAVTSIAWTGEYFCAVSGHSSLINPVGLPTAYVSYDGASWQPYYLPSQQTYQPSIAWGGGRFCVIGSISQAAQQENACTSPDGRTWTQQPGYSVAPSGRSKVQSVENQFVTFGTSVKTSPDGVNWMLRPSASGYYINDTAWSGSRLCAVGTAPPEYTNGIAIISP